MGGVSDLPTATETPAIPLESIVGNTDAHTSTHTNTYSVLV